MRWDTVIPAALVAPIAADSEALSVLGPEPLVFQEGEREFAVPSVRWTLVADTEGELFEESLVQIDYWARSAAQAVTLSKAIRRLLHRDLPFTVGGVELWSMLSGSSGPRGGRDGVWEGRLDFTLTYLRERLAS